MNASDHAAVTQLCDSNFAVTLAATAIYDYTTGSDTTWPTT